ncbi:Poly(3-hydroxybutyrate) depolymerase [Roseivivax halotolerans]|uniref:Poly(3-hydroxybutyrate) depolymerase n=1 Tax=Roseivivax halotolerans TaxID=93684 RepID=A0A1I5WLD6_9RHOB|nr:hypothetical protein [Roseivivax halotolerans]SFQ20584.1 Poly(3-hydroxybutyrate) depolymerase [Roseivivax halotolerans]
MARLGFRHRRARPELETLSVATPHGSRKVVLPAHPVRAEPRRALILGFHGGHGSAVSFAGRSGLALAMHSEGHDIAFPQAVPHWADGRQRLEAGWPADRDFVETLIARQRAALGPGPMPMAMIGVSNGGMFAMRLALELPEPPALSVAVVAALPEALALRAESGPPAAMLLVQATKDPVIPWAGGEVPQMAGFSVGGRLLGAEDTLAFWKRRNRVAGAPREKRVRFGGTRAQLSFWPAPPGGADLWRIVLDGAGHRQLDANPLKLNRGSLEAFIGRTVASYVSSADSMGGQAAEKRDGPPE